MKAIEIRDPGPRYRLAACDAAMPTARSETVLIRTCAAGINRADCLQAMGLYPPPPGASPRLGLEVSGVIAALGDGVDDWRVGDPVCALLPGGGYGEYALADTACLLPVPQGIALQAAAALPEALFTAYANLIVAARLAPGESVLIHGGASGIGVMAIQLCIARGHTVFATARAEKCDAVAALGARAIAYDREDFVRVAHEATDGRGIDVILDMVGGDTITRNLQAAALGGRIVNIAYQAGFSAMVDFAPMLKKQLSMTATTLRGRPLAQKRDLRDALLREVWPLLEQGRITPHIDATFALEMADDAHRRLREGRHIGKILLAMA